MPSGRLRVGLLFVAALIGMLGAGAAFAAPHDGFDGTWLAEHPVSILKTADGADPPLLPDARKAYDARVASHRAGDNAFDPTTWCAAPGIPRLMYMPYPFQIIIGPKRTAFLYEWNHWARVIDMVSPSLEVVLPTSTGTSATGRWDGDTLVIHSAGITDSTVLDSAGLMHSDDLEVTERLRLLGPDRLEDRITLADPHTFSHPWEVVETYRRQPADRPIQEDVCLDRIKRGEPAIRSTSP